MSFGFRKVNRFTEEAREISPASKEDKRFAYRPDLDGLRALAILAVLIFHLNSSWLPAGFLGVDIFFVLSGFLVTSIIYRDVELGRFSFKEFYKRRLKRLFPLYFLVVLVTMLVAWYIFLVDDAVHVYKSALASLIFSANHYFAKSVNYFGANSYTKPFLHFWSLSIEQQFYLFFPIFLFLLLRNSRLKRHLIKILGLMVVLSLGSSLIWRHFSTNLYYFSGIRAGELLIGAWIASYGILEKKKRDVKHYRVLVTPVFVALLVCFSLGRLFTTSYFPGLLALVPCGLTGVLIYLNRYDSIVSRLLSLKPLVWLGQLSYSLYLWHWPILAIMRYLYQEEVLPFSWNVLAISLTVGLSVLTYYSIEIPLRRSRFSFANSLVLLYVLPAILVLGLSRALPRYSTVLISKELKVYQKFIDDDVDLADYKIGDIKEQPRLLFVGNSFMNHLYPLLDQVGQEEGWSGTILTSPAFPFIFDMDWNRHFNESINKKRQQRDQLVEEIYPQYDIIVLHYDAGNTPVHARQKLIETIERLSREGKMVYVLTGVVQANVPVLRNYYFSQRGLPTRELEITKVDNDLSFLPTDLQVRHVDLTPYFPKDFYIDGKPVLFDNAHWNRYGAEQIAERFLASGEQFVLESDLESSGTKE